MIEKNLKIHNNLKNTDQIQNYLQLIKIHSHRTHTFVVGKNKQFYVA